MAQRFQVALCLGASWKETRNDPCCSRTKTCGTKNRDLSHVCAYGRQLQFGKHDILKLFTWDVYLVDVRFRFAVLGRCWRLAGSSDGRHARYRRCERRINSHEFHLEYRADHMIEARLDSSVVVGAPYLQGTARAVRQSALTCSRRRRRFALIGSPFKSAPTTIAAIAMTRVDRQAVRH
jgi:hypothetical protein